MNNKFSFTMIIIFAISFFHANSFEYNQSSSEGSEKNISSNLGYSISQNNLKITTMVKLTDSIIVIKNNSDFLTCICTTSGNGSLNNPFIIENLVVDSAELSGINISNTDVYFILQNSVLNGSTMTENAGIILDNVSNGIIRNNIIKNNYYGLFLKQNSNYNSIINNTILNNTMTGINLYNSSFNLIQNNTVYKNYFGIQFSYSNLNIISFNNISSNSNYGISIELSDNNNNFQITIV